MVRRAFAALSPLVRCLLINCASGVFAGWLLLFLLLAIDTGGLATLIFSSSAPILSLAMLAGGFASTFGGAAMGTAVMTNTGAKTTD